MFECSLSETKRLGPPPDSRSNPAESIRAIREAVLSLRTFKSGLVGCGLTRIRTRRFQPFLSGSVGFHAAEDSVPNGTYTLEGAEIGSLEDHATLVRAGLHPSLTAACARLASCSVRLAPRDMLIDAVIGLEALLLSSLSKDAYRGELRFRFSLNYALLKDGPAERRAAFRLAQSLYDNRSVIAHGGAVDEAKVKVGDDTMSLRAAAFLARETLREVTKRFLPGGRTPGCVDSAFWQGLYLALLKFMWVRNWLKGLQEALGGPEAFPGFSLGVHSAWGKALMEARGKRAVFSKARWAKSVRPRRRQRSTGL